MMLLPLGTGNDFAKKVYGTKKINVENVIKSFGLYSGKLNYTVEPLDLIDYNGEKVHQCDELWAGHQGGDHRPQDRR